MTKQRSPALTPQQTRRLEYIRTQMNEWKTRCNTSTWESPFLLQVIDVREAEIAALQRSLRGLVLRQRKCKRPAIGGPEKSNRTKGGL